MCPPRLHIAVARHCTPPLYDCTRRRRISTAQRASTRATSLRARLKIPGAAIVATRRADTRSCYGPNGAALPLQAMLSTYRTFATERRSTCTVAALDHPLRRMIPNYTETLLKSE